MFKRILETLKEEPALPKSLKLQGDKKNGIFIVKEFYKPNGDILNDSDIHNKGINILNNSLNNSAIELTDPNLIGMIEYYYFEELNSEQLKEHVDKTYPAQDVLAVPEQLKDDQALPKSLKLQGDEENGVYIVKKHYMPSNPEQVLTDDDVYQCGFDFDFGDKKNMAIELTDPQLIEMVSYNYLDRLDSEQLKKHVEKTYFAHDVMAVSEHSDFIRFN